MPLPEDLKNFRAIDWDLFFLRLLACGFSGVALLFIIIFLLGV
jgi:hypothetical protein